MFQLDEEGLKLVGPSGSLTIRADDEICRKLAMLYEGRCGGLGAEAAAKKYGYSRQRYFQLLAAFREKGAQALQSQKRGPKTNYRRPEEVVKRVIRYRFLDQDISAAAIAQKLCQQGHTASQRTVERIIQEMGLQKKTPQVGPKGLQDDDRDADDNASAGPSAL